MIEFYPAIIFCGVQLSHLFDLSVVCQSLYFFSFDSFFLMVIHLVLIGGAVELGRTSTYKYLSQTFSWFVA